MLLIFRFFAAPEARQNLPQVHIAAEPPPPSPDFRFKNYKALRLGGQILKRDVTNEAVNLLKTNTEDFPACSKAVKLLKVIFLVDLKPSTC